MSFPCHLNAQTNIAGHEKYDSYNQYIYVDNLDQRLIPEIFNTTYYSKLKETDYRVDSQKIDTIQQKREIYVYTKYANDGYLLAFQRFSCGKNCFIFAIASSFVIFISESLLNSSTNWAQ